MTFVISEVLPPEICQLCSKKEELRPYGPGGIWVCFKCAMKDEKTAKAAFLSRFEENGKKSI